MSDSTTNNINTTTTPTTTTAIPATATVTMAASQYPIIAIPAINAYTTAAANAITLQQSYQKEDNTLATIFIDDDSKLIIQLSNGKSFEFDNWNKFLKALKRSTNETIYDELRDIIDEAKEKSSNNS